MQTRTLNHVAIIMDGNGRWANTRNLPRLSGHKAGEKAIYKIIEHSLSQNIEWLTLYAFSVENWQRPKNEVSGLMFLLENAFRARMSYLKKHDIRLRVIGDVAKLPFEIQKLIKEAESYVPAQVKLNLNLAINYGGRNEILEAVKKMHNNFTSKQIQELTVEEFSGFLYKQPIPDPDLLIRTSGEQRISNFFLWQLAYTELYFTDVLWPDFDINHYQQAINAYLKRDRRYGKV